MRLAEQENTRENNIVTSAFYGVRKNEYCPNGYAYDELNFSGAAFPYLKTREHRAETAEVGIPGVIVKVFEDDDGYVAFTDSGYAYTQSGVYAGLGRVKDVIRTGRDYYCVPSGAMLIRRSDGTRVRQGNMYFDLSEDEITFEIMQTDFRNYIPAVRVPAGNVRVTTNNGVKFSENFNIGDKIMCFTEFTYFECEVLEVYENNLFIANSDTENNSLFDAETIGAMNNGTGILSILKTFPVDHAVERNNRIWGCRYGGNMSGFFVNEIFCAALDDPQRYMLDAAYDDMDPYTVSVGAQGAFTGCCVLRDHIVFFKEHSIIFVTGNAPSNYTVSTLSCNGVQKGSEKSIAVYNGYVYYKSVDGIMKMSADSMSVCISDELGDDNYREAIGGINGGKYYIQMKDKDDRETLFVYETETGRWHKESAVTGLVRFCNIGNNLLALCTDENNRTSYEYIYPFDRYFPEAGKLSLSNLGKYIVSFAEWLPQRQRLMQVDHVLGKKDINDNLLHFLYTVNDDKQYPNGHFTKNGAVFINGKKICPENVLPIKGIPEIEKSSNKALLATRVSAYWTAYGQTAFENIITDENDFAFERITGDHGLTENYIKPKHINVNAKLGENSELLIEVMYDDDGKWEEVARLSNGDGTNKMAAIEKIMNRCKSYKFKFSGHGDVVIYSISILSDMGGTRSYGQQF